MLEIPADILQQIYADGERAYPEEGAGFLLGKPGDVRQVQAILCLPNAQEEAARHSRYLITPQDMLAGEREAEKTGLEILGVFHSHPDHPNRPSEYDLAWAMPWFSYLITSVHDGKALDSRSWLLRDDRSGFDEEKIIIG